MYFRDLGLSLVRRWPLLLIGIVLTAGLATAVFMFVPASWTARASVLILPPATVVGDTGNPYLFLGGLGQASDVLAKRLDAEDAHTSAQERYNGGDFTVGTDRGSPAPVILIEVDAPTASEALELVGNLHSQVPLELGAMQRDLDVPSAALITTSDITVDSVATLNPRARIQLTAIAAVGGIALTVLLIGFFDGLARRRRRRPGSDPDAKADADADADELSELDELDTIPENERMREPAYRSRTASDETATA